MDSRKFAFDISLCVDGLIAAKSYDSRKYVYFQKTKTTIISQFFLHAFASVFFFKTPAHNWFSEIYCFIYAISIALNEWSQNLTRRERLKAIIDIIMWLSFLSSWYRGKTTIFYAKLRLWMYEFCCGNHHDQIKPI